MALTICACLSAFFLLQTGSCVLFQGSEALSWLMSLLVRGRPRVQEAFLFQSSLPGVQVPFGFLSHFLFSLAFFFCSTQLHGDFLALSEVRGLLPAFGRYSVRIIPHVDVLFFFF